MPRVGQQCEGGPKMVVQGARARPFCEIAIEFAPQMEARGKRRPGLRSAGPLGRPMSINHGGRARLLALAPAPIRNLEQARFT